MRAGDSGRVRVAAVVLAAGASRRMGAAKQVMELKGETLLDRAVRVAGEAGLRPVIVVLGARAAEVRAGCALCGAEVVENAGWAEGMGSSVRVGVGRLEEEPEVGGVVLLTCDMPSVTAEHLRGLCVGGAVVASGYGGRRGVPAYFPRASFAALRRMEGDAGARELLREARAVELPGGELDVDTPEALAAARAREAGGQ